MKITEQIINELKQKIKVIQKMHCEKCIRFNFRVCQKNDCQTIIKVYKELLSWINSKDEL